MKLAEQDVSGRAGDRPLMATYPGPGTSVSQLSYTPSPSNDTVGIVR